MRIGIVHLNPKDWMERPKPTRETRKKPIVLAPIQSIER
jgi:hypothetical protein